MQTSSLWPSLFLETCGTLVLYDTVEKKKPNKTGDNSEKDRSLVSCFLVSSNRKKPFFFCVGFEIITELSRDAFFLISG
jgi:hypothetical protein